MAIGGQFSRLLIFLQFAHRPTLIAAVFPAKRTRVCLAAECDLNHTDL